MFNPQAMMKLGEHHAIKDIKNNLRLATVIADGMSRPLTAYGLGYFHTVNDYVRLRS